MKNVSLERVRPVLRTGGGAGQDEGDYAAVCHHEDRVSHRQRGARTVGFTSVPLCWIFGYTVADPGCLSRILIFIYPGSRIPDPTTKTTKEEGKIFVVLTFCLATNFTKFKIILFLNSTGKNLSQLTQN
jgi:hypothetical protein